MASTTAKAAIKLPWYKTGKGLGTAGMGLVFAFALYISGKHIIHVALHYGQTPDVAYPLPAIIDLFALFCAIRRRQSNSDIQKKLTATGMWGMLLVSLWFNIESALIDAIGQSGEYLAKALFIGAIAAIVVAGAAEILTHTRKAPSKPASKAPSKAATASTPTKVTTPRPRKKPAIETLSEATTV